MTGPLPPGTATVPVTNHLANERTHLAYLRTSVSLISFGITVNRFSLYLLQQRALEPGHGSRVLLRNTERVGFGMVVLGLALVVVATWRYVHVARQIARGAFVPNHVVPLLVSLALFGFGVLSVIWLFIR